jgi:XTP/dITP diphosphohydrolase
VAELPGAGSAPPGSRLLDLVAVQDRLRSPGGCPWDAEQTHASLVRHLLEEAYELADAIDAGDREAVREELGDVLLQVTFHARIAAEDPDEPFTIDDVAGGITDKLVRRHPHVFAGATAETAADVEALWGRQKAEEKRRTSVTEGVPTAQPALSLAQTLQRKAARLWVPEDFVVPEADTAPDLASAVSAAAAEVEVDGGVEAVGRLLFAAVALARASGVEAETALRGRARELRERLRVAEHSAHDDGLDPADLDAAGWAERWGG